MTVNLDKELASFKERIRTDGSVKVTRASDYSGGGGAIDFTVAAALFLLLARRRRGQA
jgi:rhombotail lipoprotein